MPLTAELSAEVGRRLRKMRDDVLAEARSRIDSAPDDRPVVGPGAHTGQNDDMPTAEMISHDEEHLAERETAELHEIDVALGRLEHGGYGICVECGREIDPDRLLAMPTTQTCFDCQAILEKEQRLRNGPPPTM
jgi:DnaK suppressor protein